MTEPSGQNLLRTTFVETAISDFDPEGFVFFYCLVEKPSKYLFLLAPIYDAVLLK